MKRILFLMTFLPLWMACSMSYAQDHGKKLQGIPSIPAMNSRTKQCFNFPDTIVECKGHKFKCTCMIGYADNKTDTMHIKVFMWTKDLLMDDKSIEMTANTSLSDIDRETAFELKNGKFKKKFKNGIVCLPPIAERGKELFFYAKLYFDISDQDACYVKYKIKEKRTRKPFINKWPKEYYKNNYWPIFRKEE